MTDTSSYLVILVSPQGDAAGKAGVAERLVQSLRISPEVAQQLVSRPRTIVKRGLSADVANKLADRIRACGCDAQVQAQEVQAQEEEAAVPSPASAPPGNQPSEPASSGVPAVPPQPASPADVDPNATVILSPATAADTAPPPHADQSNSQSSTEPSSQASPQSPSQSPYEAPQADVGAEQKVFCRSCGRKISMDEPQCPACGAQQLAGQGKSKVVAGLLAFFLGGFGLHRFYLGQWWGIFYFLLSWTFIPGLVAMVEAIVFWLTSEDVWYKKHGHKPAGSAIVIIIVGLVAMMVFVSIVGILAAIAVPQYQNYVVRAKVVSSLGMAAGHRSAVSAYYQRYKRLPNNNSDVGIQPFTPTESILDMAVSRRGVIRIAFQPELIPGNEDAGLDLIPSVRGGVIEWRCTSDTIDSPFLPQPCRDGATLGAEFGPDSTAEAPPVEPAKPAFEDAETRREKARVAAGQAASRAADQVQAMQSLSKDDFVFRANIQSGLSTANVMKIRVTEYYYSTGEYPSSNKIFGLPDRLQDDLLSGLFITNGGTIVLQFADGVLPSSGGEISLTPTAHNTGRMSWKCVARGIPSQLVPDHCSTAR